MRQIIDGLLYDTETAKALGEASAGGSVTDFSWWSEALYRSPRGRYFVAGRGNAASRWAEHYAGGSRGPGEGIRAVTEERAREWSERYLSPEEYEAAFGAAESA